MIIAIVEFEIAAEAHAKVLEVLAKDGAEALQLKGCLGFKTLRVAGAETGWMLVEEWQDMAAFDTYKASAGFARLGAGLGPLMLAPPRSRDFEVALA